MARFIYADNAATTKLDIDAFEAMKPFLLNEYSNPSQPYSFSRESRKAIREARASIAECINAEPDEIYFTSGGTESDNWALKGIALACPEKKTILTSKIEHHAILNACKSLEYLGYPVTYLSVNKYGEVDLKTLIESITSKTLNVSIMYANNEIGTIQNIKELASIAHNNGAVFHTDAVQAVGHIQIDVKDTDVDLLSASAHKFNGPKGVGFLFIKRGTKIVSLLDGGAQEHNLRAGTENTAGIVGMAVALKKSCAQLESSKHYLRALEKQFIECLNLTKIKYIRNGSQNRIPGNISLSIAGTSGETILHRLDLKGISISTGSACDSINTQVSHVIRAINVPDEYKEGTIRISLSKDNTSDDILKIVEALESVCVKQG